MISDHGITAFSCRLFSYFQTCQSRQLFDCFFGNQLSFVFHQIFLAARKNVAGDVLFQDDAVTLYINFDGVSFL